MSLKPSTLDKYIGIELEITSNSSLEDARRLVRRLKLQDLVDVGTDGSIDAEDFDRCGLELRVLTKRKSLKKDIESLKPLLNSLRAAANDSCGLHVHLDARNYNPLLMFKRLIGHQKTLYSMVQEDRRVGVYSEPLYAQDMLDMEDDFDSSGDHYDGINVAALSEHNTIELRMHEGTVDLTEVYNWARYLYNLAYGIPLNEKDKSYSRTRIKMFSSSGLGDITSLYFDHNRARRNSELYRRSYKTLRKKI